MHSHIHLHKSSSKKYKNLAYTVAAFFVLFTLAIPLIPVGSAGAASTTYVTETSADNKAKAIRYYSMLHWCVQSIKTTISGEDITKGPQAWLSSSKNVTLGTMLDSWGDSNGLTSCNGEGNDPGWTEDMFRVYGYDTSNWKTVLTKLGYNCSTTNGTDTCKNSDAQSVDEHNFNSVINKIVANSPYMNGYAPTSDVAAMNYYIAKKTLLETGSRGCGMTANGTTNKVTVSIVDESTGAISTSSQGTNGSTLNYPKSLDDIGSGQETAKCSQIATAVQTNGAAAYAKWLGKNACRPISTISGETALSACADGWLNRTDYTKCISLYASTSETASREACFTGQDLNIDQSNNKTVGSSCYSLYPSSVTAAAACISGAQNGTNYCSNTYGPSDNLTASGKPSSAGNSTLLAACSAGANLTSKASGNSFGKTSTVTCPDGQTADSTGTCVANTNDNCPLDESESMRWLGCSVFSLLNNAANALKDQLSNYLYADPNVLFNSQAQQAATVFRNIGMVLIVVAGLIMVISQALGFEFLDAYTIRKLMPRLGVSLVGMALAWPLLKFGVTLINDLGGLVYSVFISIANSAGAGASTSTSDLGTAMGTVLASVVAASGVVIALGAVGALSLIGTIVLALIIGLLVLSVRQLIIFIALIMAPLFIAAYVIPGGQKLWNFWKNTLLTTLFMYPLIMGFIGAGAAMAYIMPENGTNMSLLAIIVYFAPYFMLPFAFKMAGGLMSTIFSIVNDKNRGVFDRLKKQRQGIREDRIKRAQNNSLWDPNSRLQKALHANTWASAVTDPMGNIAHTGRKIPGFRKSGSAIDSQINSARTEQTGKLFEELNNKYGFNDKAFRVLSGAHDGLSEETKGKLGNLAGKKITSLSDIQRMADILQSSGDVSERLAANSLRNASGRLATLNKDPEMLRADVTGAGMMGLAAHGFATSEDLAESGNLLMKNGLSAGAAQSLVVQSQLYGVRGRPDVKAGYGVVFDGKEGKFESGITTTSKDNNRAVDLLKSLSASDMAGAKSGAFDALAPTIKQVIGNGGQDAIAVQEQLFSWAGQYSQASADVKAKALQFISDGGPLLQDAFAKYNREYDPARRGAEPPTAQEPPQPPGGGGAPH